ncbi:MAG: DUF4012 domain-containing protein [Chloroflexota bacterium]
MSITRKVPPTEPPGRELAPRQRRRRRSGWAHRIRRRIQRIRWTKVLLVVVALGAVGIVTALAVLVDSANRVQSSITSFQRVVNSLSEQTGTDLTMLDFERLDSSVNDLSSSLTVIRARLAFARPFEALNANLRTTITSIDAAYNLTQAAHEMLNGLQPTLFFLVSGDDGETVVSQISSGERIVELLQIGRGQFASAGEHLRLAKASMDSLNLEGASSSVVLDIQQLNKYHDQLTQINDVLMNAPDFLTGVLGVSGDRNYLVLSQNNDELRPSGGYLSTYGWITIRGGRVTDYSYSPTTTTSPNPPPAEFAAQINMPDWWIRYQEPVYAAWDGSWYADFPSTARMAMSYYNAGNNPQSPVNGTIAIDITGFEDLLEIIGSVTVPGYSTRVTSDNFREIVYDLRSSNNDDLAHKRFIATLYQEIFSEWQNTTLDPTRNSQLLRAILRALQEKHIMLYVNDEQLNHALNLLGWSGAQASATDHDYVLVADANLGNKSNHSIIRSLTYDADIQENGAISGRLTVAYDYSAQTAANDPAVNPPINGSADYYNLLQIFVPRGTEFRDATNLSTTPIVSSNAENTEFITRLFVPFDSSQRYQFSYLTAPLVEDLGSYQRYRLLIQKQPGTPANAVSVQIMLPANAALISSAPEADASYNLDRPILEYRTDLSVDRWIEIIYRD